LIGISIVFLWCYLRILYDLCLILFSKRFRFIASPNLNKSFNWFPIKTVFRTQNLRVHTISSFFLCKSDNFIPTCSNFTRAKNWNRWWSWWTAKLVVATTGNSPNSGTDWCRRYRRFSATVRNRSFPASCTATCGAETWPNWTRSRVSFSIILVGNVVFSSFISFFLFSFFFQYANTIRNSFFWKNHCIYLVPTWQNSANCFRYKNSLFALSGPIKN